MLQATAEVAPLVAKALDLICSARSHLEKQAHSRRSTPWAPLASGSQPEEEESVRHVFEKLCRLSCTCLAGIARRLSTPCGFDLRGRVQPLRVFFTVFLGPTEDRSAPVVAILSNVIKSAMTTTHSLFEQQAREWDAAWLEAKHFEKSGGKQHGDPGGRLTKLLEERPSAPFKAAQALMATADAAIGVLVALAPVRISNPRP